MTFCGSRIRRISDGKNDATSLSFLKVGMWMSIDFQFGRERKGRGNACELKGSKQGENERKEERGELPFDQKEDLSL